MEKKKAQIWVETVVYTLIGISIIGILLAVAKPKIDEMRDRMVIEQTIDSLNILNSKIIETGETPGNQRKIVFKLTQGRLTFDSSADSIVWELISDYKYSELNTLVPLGSINVLTEEADPYKVSLFLNYSFYNLTNQDLEKTLELEGSPTPYNLVFFNKGIPSGFSNLNIDLTLKN